MKFILTGCTGFIGSEVLSQCLLNPTITSIIALSRRPLPGTDTKNPKLEVIVMKDFNLYPDSVLKRISGADACIWCMGTTAGIKELEIDFPLAFGNAFSKTLIESKKKIRYIHLSGAATERDQTQALWFKDSMRKMKGLAEMNMLEFARKEELRGLWETLIVKSGFVIHKDIQSPRDAMGWMMGDSKTIRVNELAALMIDASMVGGWKEDTLQDNQEMVRRGREAVEKMKGIPIPER